MVYRYRAGYGFKGIDAKVVGSTIDGLMAARGKITPGEVVDESRPDDAPLHPIFEWDDAVAAEKHREDQARQVIRSYVVIERDEDGREREEIVNISVASPFDRDGPAYMPARRAMEDPERRARIVALAQSQLDAWKARYAHLEELAEIVAAIQQARAAQQPARPARERYRRPARQPQPAMA